MSIKIDQKIGYLLLVVILLGFAVKYLPDCEIEFNDASDIVGSLLGYAIIATIVEQFVEFFFLKSETKEYRLVLEEYKIEKESKDAYFKTSGIIEVDKVQSYLSLKDKLDTVKDKIISKLNQYSFIICLVISLLGYNFFAEITEISNTPCEYCLLAYRGLGVLMTAILLASGSAFVRAIIQNNS